MVAAIGLSVGLIVERELIYLWIGLGLACLSTVSLFLYARLDERYRFEPNAKLLFFDRSFLGMQLTRQIASTDEMHCVVAQGQIFSRNDHRSSRPGYRYGTTLVLKSGRILELTRNETTSFEAAASSARHAAHQFGISQLGEERKLMKVVGKHTPKIQFQEHKFEDGRL